MNYSMMVVRRLRLKLRLWVIRNCWVVVRLIMCFLKLRVKGWCMYWNGRCFYNLIWEGWVIGLILVDVMKNG